MKRTVNHKTNRIVFLIVAIAVAVCVSTFHGNQSATYGDVRETTPKRAFKSGGARSELVLREISATLKSIDQRLERMERLVAEQAKSKSEQ